MCLKRKHPLIVLFMSSGQTWTTGELMRLTLSHVVCESLIFPLFFIFTHYNIMKSKLQYNIKSKEILFEPKREKHVTKREGVMEAMEQTRWSFLVLREISQHL